MLIGVDMRLKWRELLIWFNHDMIAGKLNIWVTKRPRDNRGRPSFGVLCRSGHSKVWNGCADVSSVRSGRGINSSLIH